MSRSRWLLLGAGCLLAVILAAVWIGRNRGVSEMQLAQAVAEAEAGHADSAIRLFDEILKVAPAHSQALLYRGQLARDAGDVKAAQQFWSRVPDEPVVEAATAQYLLGSLFLEMNKARDAEDAFLLAIELNPDHLKAHERLLKLYVVQLRVAEIRQQLDAIRQFRPWNLDELHQLVYLTGRVTNTTSSTPRVEKFVEADPEDWHSFAALGRFYLWDDRYQDAERVLRRALTHRSDDPFLTALLAEALIGQSDLNGAAETLKLIPLGPDAIERVWRSHGLYFLALEDWPQAAACLKQAVALDSTDPASVYKTAHALERAGDATAAQQFFKRVKLLEQLRAQMSLVAERDRDSQMVPFDAVAESGTLLLQLDRPGDAVPFFEQALAWKPDSPSLREKLAQAQHRAEIERDRVALPSKQPQIQQPAVEEPPTATGLQKTPTIQLVDRHQEAGLVFQNFTGQTGQKYLLETTGGGGVAVLDYDGDQWPDLYFPQGCRLPFDPTDTAYTDRLFRNVEGKFTDVSTAAGVDDNQFGQGCAASDYNNDGFSDLAVATFGTTLLYRNNGDGTLTDVSEEAGLRGRRWATSLGWGDLDCDGNLDLYVVTYVADAFRLCQKPTGAPATCHPRLSAAEDDVLFWNRGDGTFADVSRQAGIAVPDGKGLGLIIADLNDDAWPEVFVANDTTPNFLFKNLKSKEEGPKFEEVGLASGSAVSVDGLPQAGMGIACGDFNDDARLDLYVTYFHKEYNGLYLNGGDLLFEDAARQAGLVEATKPMVGFGTQGVDFDLDGRLDLFVANGHVDDHRDEGIPWKMPAQVFYNLGAGRFADVSLKSGDFFRRETLGRGAARLDWNRDGLQELVVVQLDEPAGLLRNETPGPGNRLVLKLCGTKCNRDAIGARIRVEAEGRSQILEICGGDGYCSSNELRQVAGLGSAKVVELLEIRWPGGRLERWTNLPANADVTVIEGAMLVVQPLPGVDRSPM